MQSKAMAPIELSSYTLLTIQALLNNVKLNRSWKVLLVGNMRTNFMLFI